MRLLIVDDNKPLADSLRRILSADYAIDSAHFGQDGVSLALTHEYDLIILDLNLPDVSGYEVCREIRRNQLATPILILTAQSGAESKVALLNSGADDYLVKPFSKAELKARLRALTRRGVLLRPTILKVGEFRLNSSTRSVLFRGKPLKLSRKEYLVLQYLLKHPNEALNRYKIMEQVWEQDPFSLASNTIDVHINNLRRKIGRPTSHKLIQTIHGTGYMLVTPP